MTSPPSKQPSTDTIAAAPPVRVCEANVGYDVASPVLAQVSLDIPEGSFTAIIGPNACGKSTLLRTIGRTLKPWSGSVLLDGADIMNYPAKEVARRMGLLPQSALAPEGIRVAELVARGRFPHQGLLRQWSAADRDAVNRALVATRTHEHSGRLVDELSGGQRQRVWVAMLLAQETPIMLLDEPTTYLDIAHQYELLDLLAGFNRDGRTVVTVLHDLNQAARYASHLVVMKDGAVEAIGTPSDVITPEVIERVFDLPCVVVPDPVTGTPAVFPR